MPTVPVVLSRPMIAFTLLVLAATQAACGGAQSTAAPVCAPCVGLAVETPDVATGTGPHENLMAVAWTQTSTEARAIQMQTFAAATAELDAALADTAWTAAPEQSGDFASLPPAVIVDVDETILDNSAYQAWLIVSGNSFSPATWDDWCDDEQAVPVPGAPEFVAAAEQLGVTVLYVTNRNASCEAATVNNLGAHGMATTAENVVTRDESSAGSAKGERRAAIATEYRVIMMIGDNLGDFVDGYNATNRQRDAIISPYTAWWGERWFMVPNPTYGSWVNAIAPESEGQIEQLRNALDVWEPQPAAE